MKNTYFITVFDNMITGSFYGDIAQKLAGFEGHERHEVSEKTSVNIGEPVNFYNADWQRKTDRELLDDGLIELPDGFILDGDYIREMTYEEKNPPKEPTAEELAELERKQLAYEQITEAEAAMQALTEEAVLAFLKQQDAANVSTRTRSMSASERYASLRQQRDEAKAELEKI
jgi:hypothetical protein